MTEFYDRVYFHLNLLSFIKFVMLLQGPDLKRGSDNAELIISKGADAKSGCSLNDMKLVQ